MAVDNDFSEISIHAPREGGDIAAALDAEYSPIISIHAPREGGDYSRLHGLYLLSISIHAPREGGDSAVKS